MLFRSAPNTSCVAVDGGGNVIYGTGSAVLEWVAATQQIILLQIRLPRILAAGVVGAALAVSGLMFQGLFRNPLADPYVIGSSGGAVLGACIGIFFFSQLSLFGFSATTLLAFAGSVATMVIVYWLARTNGRTNVVTLLLAGFAVSTIDRKSVV